MEIKQENKFKRFFKRFGALSLACVLSLAIALTIAFVVPREEGEPASTNVITFDLPMNNSVVVKDFADDRLQLNESLKRWEIHLAVDLSSENAEVFSVCDGVVASVGSNSLDGGIVTIQHKDGFVSVYSSLADEIKVKEGDAVKKGQEIGKARSEERRVGKECM